MSRARLFRSLLFLVALALVAWTLSRVPLAEAWTTVQTLDVPALAVLVALNLVALLTFGLKWWIVLRGLGHPISFWHTSLYRLIGFGLAYFTPGPRVGGEPAQVLLAERRHGVPRDVAIASVGLDRLIDAAVNFGVLASVALLFFDSGGFWFPVAVLAAPSAYLVALARGLRPVSALIRRDVVRLSESRAGQFCRERSGHVALAFAAAFASWAITFAEYWLVAFFLGTRLSFFELAVGLTAARLAYYLFVPAALGVLEAGQVMAVSALGLPASLGLSLSLVIRMRDVLVASVGLFFGFRMLSGAFAAPPAVNPSKR